MLIRISISQRYLVLSVEVDVASLLEKQIPTRQEIARKHALPNLHLKALTWLGKTMRVTLYKPMALADILKRLRADFFGTTFRHTVPTAERYAHTKSRATIVQLTMKDEGCLLPPSGASIPSFEPANRDYLSYSSPRSRQITVQRSRLSDSLKQVFHCFQMAQKTHPSSGSEVKRITFAIRTAATSLDTYVKAVCRYAIPSTQTSRH